MAKLSKRAHRPTDDEQLQNRHGTRKEQDHHELIKMEAQHLSGFTKDGGEVHPTAMMREIEKGSRDKKFTDAWTLVVKREWHNVKKSDDDMDADVTEGSKLNDFDSLKGEGKGVFQGYWSHCSVKTQTCRLWEEIDCTGRFRKVEMAGHRREAGKANVIEGSRRRS